MEHGEVFNLPSAEFWKSVGLDHPFDTELTAGVQSFELRRKAHKNLVLSCKVGTRKNR